MNLTISESEIVTFSYGYIEKRLWIISIIKVLFDGLDLTIFNFGLLACNTLNLVYSSILILFAMVVECSASSSELNFDKNTNSLVYYFVENQVHQDP